MKWLLLVLAFINGGFMLADGIHVLIKGKYIGPEKPGPWSVLFSRFHINVFQLGPVFILFGAAWLIFGYFLWTGQAGMRSFGMLLSLLTLWYLPFGTLIAIITFLVLWIRYH